MGLRAAAIGANLFFFVMTTRDAGLAVVLLMMLMTIVPKMNFLEGASAEGLVNTGDVTGLFTPLQAPPADGKDLPYWLVVWPSAAAAGPGPGAGPTRTMSRLGAAIIMWCLLVTVVMKAPNVRRRRIVWNVPYVKGRPTFEATVPPTKVALPHRRAADDRGGAVKVTWTKRGSAAPRHLPIGDSYCVGSSVRGLRGVAARDRPPPRRGK